MHSHVPASAGRPAGPAASDLPVEANLPYVLLRSCEQTAQNRLRENGDLTSYFKMIWAVQSPAQKYSAFLTTQISGYFPAVPSRQEGRIARRHERGTGCDGRRQRQA
jgi:hypothetical protein